jgi:prophage endopeptidase
MNPLNVMNWPSPWVAMVIFATGLGIGSSGAWLLGRAPLQVQLSQLTASHAQERTAQATAAAQALTDAQTRGDLLTAGLLTQAAQINQLKSEKTRAITQATTGSTCLREPALRLLNSAPGLSVAGLPPATGGAAAARGAPATAGGVGWVSTDTDVSSWAIDVGAAYATCRARLDALIDWHTGQPTPAPEKP